MITNLYIIDQGVSLYSYSISDKMFIHEQLFTGYLSAFGSFAQELFKHGLHSIQIKNGQKLIFYLESQFNLVFCAIAHEKDNDYILQKHLSSIADSFKIMFKKKLESDARHALEEYKEFDSQLSNLLENRGFPRDIRSLAKGLAISGISLFASVLTLYFILNSLVFIPLDIRASLFVILWIIDTAFLSALSGYIAGNTKLGSLNGISFFLLMTALVFFFVQMFFIAYLLISYFVILICWATGFFGGYYGDRRKLYPIEEQSQ